MILGHVYTWCQSGPPFFTKQAWALKLGMETMPAQLGVHTMLQMKGFPIVDYENDKAQDFVQI